MASFSSKVAVALRLLVGQTQNTQLQTIIKKPLQNGTKTSPENYLLPSTIVIINEEHVLQGKYFSIISDQDINKYS